MIWLYLVLGLIYLTDVLAAYCVQLKMSDEVEKDLPLDQRPSWMVPTWEELGRLPLRSPLYVFGKHREMYPQSRLRMRLVLLLAVQAGIMVAVFFLASRSAGRT